MILYAVAAQVPALQQDLYFVSTDQGRAKFVSARLKQDTYACIIIHEYDVEKIEVEQISNTNNTNLTDLKDLYYSPSKDELFYSSTNNSTNYSSSSSSSSSINHNLFLVKLDYFYIDGISGITSSSSSSNDPLHFSFEEFEKDEEMNADFGQGVGEIYGSLMQEYAEKTGNLCDSDNVLNKLWEVVDHGQPQEEIEDEENEEKEQKEEEFKEDDIYNDEDNNNDQNGNEEEKEFKEDEIYNDDDDQNDNEEEEF